MSRNRYRSTNEALIQEVQSGIFPSLEYAILTNPVSGQTNQNKHLMRLIVGQSRRLIWSYTSEYRVESTERDIFCTLRQVS